MMRQKGVNVYYPSPESSVLEFKKDFPKNDQIIKTIIGFCNQNGGELVIGVNDQGRVIGLSEEKIEKALSSLDKAIYEASSPPIIPRVYIKRFAGKGVIVIEVSSGMNKPYYRRKEGMTKGTYIRLGRNTIRASRDIIEELKWKSSNIDYESLPIYKATKDDLDEEKIRGFLSHRRNGGKGILSAHIYDSYSLLTKEHGREYPTVAGMLLFGIRPQKFLSEAMIICTHFKGNSGRNVLATIDCENDLFHQFGGAFAFLTARLYRSFTIKGKQREESLEIPEVALREALLNAIIHRNYHIKAPIKVAIFDNRVEIFSPGQFPGPLNVANLSMGITYLRNPAICKVLREAGYVEKLGTGFITIFESFRKRNLKTPEVVEGENYIKVILPRGSHLGFKEETEDERILQLIEKNEEITIQQVMDLLSVSRATAHRRLNDLVKMKKVKRLGKTRSVRYCLR